MFKYLFFDDQRLLLRQNLERQYGEVSIAGIYNDSKLTTSYGWVWVCRGTDNKVHMVYMGLDKDDPCLLAAAAVSDDGVNFVPRNTAAESGLTDPIVPNQILPPCGEGTEIACVITDHLAPPEERYKMLMCDCKYRMTEYRVIDSVYSSADLIRWKEMPGSCWNKVGTEPIAGAFYNSVHNVFTILSRPDCGQRRVCIVETADWHNFTEPELCMQCDSLDPVLAEVYGMNAFEYDGIFIGIPLIYGNIPQIRMQKYRGGSMHGELAYSLDGRHWQRSLRTPFIDGAHPDLVKAFGKPQNMVFPCSTLRQQDGSVLIYAAVTDVEHGTPPGGQLGHDHIVIFKMRQDGFIRLTSADKNSDSLVAFREVCWNGGELSVNISAENATCAVYEMVTQAFDTELRLSHEDCKPFSGNSCAWHPRWKNGATLDDFKGKTIVFEIKFRDGSIYSCSGNGTALMDLEAERYRQFGEIRTRKGM